MRSCSVSSVSSGRTGTASWARIGPVVDLEGGEVHGAAGDLHARGQRVVHRVPALERRQQRGMGVDDPAGEGVVDRLGEDGAEAGHRHQVDVVAARARRRTSWVYATRSKSAPKLVRSTSSAATPASSAIAERAARAVGEHDRDGQVGVEHGAQDGAAPRCQHRETAHACESSREAPAGTGASRILAMGSSHGGLVADVPQCGPHRGEEVGLGHQQAEHRGRSRSGSAASLLLIFSFFHWLSVLDRGRSRFEECVDLHALLAGRGLGVLMAGS